MVREMFRNLVTSQGTRAACERDTYQNGGYWGTPTGWLHFGKAATEAIVDRVKNRGEGLVLVFPFPGAIGKLRASDLKFTPLVYTGKQTGVVSYNDLFEGPAFMPRREMSPNPKRTVIWYRWV